MLIYEVPIDEGWQYGKFYISCNKEERLILNYFFRDKEDVTPTPNNYKPTKVVYHPVSCFLHPSF